MAHYFCQMIDYDTEDGWSSISSFGPKSAAIEYAEYCNARSGGDLFPKVTSVQTVIVQDKSSGVRQRFEVEVEFVKEFHAKAVDQQSVPTAKDDL